MLKLWIGIFLFCIVSIPLSAVDKFVVITPEKTGTHLLLRALTFLTGKEPLHIWDRAAEIDLIESYLDRAEAENRYFHMHAYALPSIMELFRIRGYKVIFLLRDPRDQLISLLFFLRDWGWEYNEALRTSGPFGRLSFDQQVEEMITGEKYGYQVPYEFIIRRLGWVMVENPVSFKTYFENLVGEKGGGTRELQLRELKNLSQFIGLSYSEKEYEHIADNLYGWTGLDNFRQGKIGSWQRYFSPRHMELFRQHFGRLLIWLEYEDDFEWVKAL